MAYGFNRLDAGQLLNSHGQHQVRTSASINSKNNIIKQ